MLLPVLLSPEERVESHTIPHTQFIHRKGVGVATLGVAGVEPAAYRRVERVVCRRCVRRRRPLSLPFSFGQILKTLCERISRSSSLLSAGNGEPRLNFHRFPTDRRWTSRSPEDRGEKKVSHIIYEFTSTSVYDEPGDDGEVTLVYRGTFVSLERRVEKNEKREAK